MKIQNIFTIANNDRVGLFLDGANLFAATRSLSIDIDYGKLRNLIINNYRLYRAYYYTAMLDDHEVSPIRPLVDWLDYNGYSLVTKPTKEFTDSATGQQRLKGNMDIEIAVDMMHAASYMDHAILFSGDGDFRYVVNTIQQIGVCTTVISTMKTSPSMIADELRRQADYFVDLNDLAPLIARN